MKCRLLICAILPVFLFAGCTKKNGDAIVVKKDFIEKVKPGATPTERQMDHDRRVVTVALVHEGRRFDIESDEKQWKKVKTGDRVHVLYYQGNYTTTVWAAEIKE